jgi:hypothetical protein
MKWILLLLLTPLFGCYSTNTSEQYVHSGTRAYQIQYGGEKYSPAEAKGGPSFFFSAITTGKFANTSTSAQKAYAYMYLAKIELKRNNLKEAISLLDKSEVQSNNFPYKYEILADYFYSNKDFIKSNKYYSYLIKWIDKRVLDVESGNFDINKLEFMNIRSYTDGKFEHEYIDMYNLKEPKQIREKKYIDYLLTKKNNALKKLDKK